MFFEILFFRILIPLIVIGILILIHEWGHYFAATRLGVVVEQFSIGLIGPKIFSFKRGKTEYVITAVPWGGYVKLQGEVPGEGDVPSVGDFYAAPAGKRVIILASGAFMNIIFAFVLFWGISFWTGMPSSAAKIGGFKDGFPAQKAGLEIGDEITAVNGEKVVSWNEMAAVIHAGGERPVELQVKRGEHPFSLILKPRVEKMPVGRGEVRRIGLIGITPLIKRYNVLKGMQSGAQQVWGWTKLTYVGLWKLIMGKVSVKNLGGPILIIQLAGKVAHSGLANLCAFMGIISINLAVINLLPIPVADGGHIIICGIEKLRRKPLSLKAQEVVAKIGWVFILTLMLFVTFNDIARITTQVFRSPDSKVRVK